MKNILKKRIKFIVIVIGVFLAINVALSFAYIRGGSVDSESVSTIALTGGQILVRYSSNTGAIAISDIKPGYEGNKQFTITSDFGENHEYYVDGIWYTVVLIVEKNEFDTNSIQYSLSLDSASEDDGITLPSIQNEGIATGTNTSGIVLGSGRFNTHNKKHVYNLKISYPDNGTDQSHEIDCEFHAYIDFINTNMVGLTFDLDGGSFTNLNLNENSSIKVPASSTIDFKIPIKVNYAFVGWEIVSGNASANNNVLTTNLSDIKLKAIWIRTTPYDYNYTGAEEEFIAEYSGFYKIETWGAQGGSYSDTVIGGYGGYSTGKILLKSNDKLHIYVGGQGSSLTTKTAVSVTGGYNGGGNGYGYTDKYVSSGGGATDIRYFEATVPSAEDLVWNSSLGLNSRIIVAGGGGGAGYQSSSYYGSGGNGGGISGTNGSYNTNTTGGTRGTQTAAGSGQSTGGFGFGGSSSGNGTGGGGGYYGGGGGQYYKGGGGGSGYIGNTLLSDKYMYCYNCDPSDVESTKTYATTCAEEIPTENCAKIGNGYARITYLHS